MKAKAAKPQKVPKELSPGECAFALHCRAEGLDPEREFRFHPVMLWRFDFAWPAHMLAVEIEGGIWSGGAHTRGKHFESDCAKYAAATLMGWRVLRYSTGMVLRGDAIRDVLEALK
jgi:very-short-patch-repair endonuclease